MWSRSLLTYIFFYKYTYPSHIIFLPSEIFCVMLMKQKLRLIDYDSYFHSDSPGLKY